MNFRASDVYAYYYPSECALRVALRHRLEPEEPAGPFSELLRKLGLRHERAHLQTLSGVIDLSGLSQDERERRTANPIRKMASRAPFIPFKPFMAGAKGVNSHLWRYDKLT